MMRKRPSNKSNEEPVELLKTPGDVAATEDSFDITSFLFHLVFLVFYVYVNVWSVLSLVAASRDKSLNYTYRPLRSLGFATMLNLYFQTGYHLLSVLCHLLSVWKMKLRLKRIQSFLFSTVGFPLSMVVSSFYWALLCISTNTLYDERSLALKVYIAPLLDHCWHSAVAVAVVLETIIVLHRYPSHRTAILTSALLTTSYFIEVMVMFYFTDFVPYPFLRKLGIRGMLIFFPCTVPFYIFFYYLGFSLSRLRWGEKTTK